MVKNITPACYCATRKMALLTETWELFTEKSAQVWEKRADEESCWLTTHSGIALFENCFVQRFHLRYSSLLFRFTAPFRPKKYLRRKPSHCSAKNLSLKRKRKLCTASDRCKCWFVRVTTAGKVHGNVVWAINIRLWASRTARNALAVEFEPYKSYWSPTDNHY